MDKYEYNLKLEEINRLVDEDNYEDAADVADTVDWKRVRNIRTLCMVSEIYEANNRLEDSKEVLMKAYRRSQMGRSVLYRLTEVCIKLREFDEAVEYYSEYVNAAPNDNSRYILKYKIYKGRGSSLEDQISILEEFKEKEYTERWAYELAKLYQKAGNTAKCIETCDDLVLWFRQGKYVIKALELKQSLAELTPMQKAIYERREELSEEPLDEEEPKMKEIENLIMEKMPSSEEEALTDSIISQTQKELAQEISLHAAENQPEPYPEPEEQVISIPAAPAQKPIAQESPAQPEAPADPAPTQPVAEEEPVPEENWYEPEVPTGATKVVPVREIRAARRAAIARQVAHEMKETEQPQPAQPAQQPQSEEAAQPEKVQLVQPQTKAQVLSQAAEQQKAAPSPAYDMAKLQADLASSMRDIVAGIKRPEGEGELIEPKNDLSGYDRTSVQDLGGGQESIDDILLTMSGIDPAAEPVKPASDAVPAAPVIPEPAAEPVPPVIPAAQPRVTLVPEQPAAPAAPNPAPAVQPVSEVPAAPEAQKPAPPVQPQPEPVSVQSAPVQPAAAPAQTPASGDVSEGAQRRSGLTANQQHILGYFATIQGLREQIAAALEDTTRKVMLDKTSRSGNLIITGSAGSGRSTLAMRYAKIVSRARGQQNARIAKIYAEDFNKKDIPSTVAKIAGGTLIIEEAGDLTEEVVNQLSKAMEFRTDGLVVVLEDERSYLKEMLDHHSDFAEKFTCAIDVPIFTNDELVSFGQTYALEEDYKIDEAAISALYDRIGELQTPDHPVTVADVKEITDQAMRRANRPGLGKLGRILSKKRFDAENRIVLYAKDFK